MRQGGKENLTLRERTITNFDCLLVALEEISRDGDGFYRNLGNKKGFWEKIPYVRARGPDSLDENLAVQCLLFQEKHWVRVTLNIEFKRGLDRGCRENNGWHKTKQVFWGKCRTCQVG